MQNNVSKKAAVSLINDNLKGKEALQAEQNSRDISAAFSIPALAANGTHIALSAGSIRLSFIEKAQDGMVAGRAAVIMDTPNVVELYKALHRLFAPMMEAQRAAANEAKTAEQDPSEAAPGSETESHNID